MSDELRVLSYEFPMMSDDHDSQLKTHNSKLSTAPTQKNAEACDQS